MAAVGVYISAEEEKGRAFALLGTVVCVFLRQSLPSCTFPINVFTLKIMEVWIIVLLIGLKARIRGIIHRKHSSLAILPDEFCMCSINLHAQ